MTVLHVGTEIVIPANSARYGMSPKSDLFSTSSISTENRELSRCQLRRLLVATEMIFMTTAGATNAGVMTILSVLAMLCGI